LPIPSLPTTSRMNAHNENERAHVFDPGRHADIRPTHARSPQRSVKSVARPRLRPCPLAPIKPHQACLTSPRAHLRRPDAPPEIWRALFRPPLPPEPRPPWPAHSSYFQVAPAAWLASPIACEAFLALRPGRTSPENQDRPCRTSVARLHA
jgi:hypothetical protein